MHSLIVQKMGKNQNIFSLLIFYVRIVLTKFFLSIIHNLLSTNSNSSNRKLLTDLCDKKRHFVCSAPRTDLATPRACPAGYRRYKDKCLYVGAEKLQYKEAQESCASSGAIIMPVKDRATYQFVRSLAKLKKYEDMYIGMNFSQNLESPLYSDGKVFNRSVDFQFDSEAEKFGTKECVYLKKGVSYKPRSTNCDESKQYICLWRSKKLDYL